MAMNSAAECSLVGAAAWGRHMNAGMVPIGTVGGQGLLAEHIESSGLNATATECREQGIVIDARATTTIDEKAAIRHSVEGGGIENVRRGVRQRQQIDQNVGFAQCHVEGRFPGQAPHAFDGFFASRPSRDGEIKLSQSPAGILAGLPQPQDCNAPLSIFRVTVAKPFAFGLIAGIAGVVAVEMQHPVDDVAGHVEHQQPVLQANDRHVARKVGIERDVGDTGADRKDVAKVLEGFQQTGGRRPDHRIVDLLGISDCLGRAQIRFDAGRNKRVLPDVRRCLGPMKEDCHGLPARCGARSPERALLVSVASTIARRWLWRSERPSRPGWRQSSPWRSARSGPVPSHHC